MGIYNKSSPKLRHQAARGSPQALAGAARIVPAAPHGQDLEIKSANTKTFIGIWKNKEDSEMQN